MISIRELSLLVEDAKLLNDLRQFLKHRILDVDVFANRCLELTNSHDQISFEKIIQILNENNLQLDRNILRNKTKLLLKKGKELNGTDLKG